MFNEYERKTGNSLLTIIKNELRGQLASTSHSRSPRFLDPEISYPYWDFFVICSVPPSKCLDIALY
jgi:hypothetical protein